MISDSFFSKWYAYGIALMIVMIAIGGITRLTDSGLSMVDWEPVAGILPPITNNHWEEEFNHYKQYPEYKEINFFREILPEYDEDRVYISDIKKVIQWYNIMQSVDLIKIQKNKKENKKEETNEI